MKRLYLILLLVGGILIFTTACKKESGYKTLIITGQNDHNWKASSKVLKLLLDQTGLFSTKIIVTSGKGGDMNRFNPDFSKYNVVVLDYNGDSWTDKTKTAFTDFVKNGGGVVVYGASDNSFPDWKEYNEMIGLGGGPARSEKNGPFVYYQNYQLITDSSTGPGGTHGNTKVFEITARNLEHPITKGLPSVWFHGADEFVSRLRGPARSMEILATATDNTRRIELRGSNRDEPVLMTIIYGKGRIFHTVLGNVKDTVGPAIQCAGFITTFQRGAEWAASGKVTQEVPLDFPNLAGVVLRPGFKEMTLEEDIAGIAKYEIVKSTKYFTDLQGRIRRSSHKGENLRKYEEHMVKVLKNEKATAEGKKLLLYELSWMGSDYCIPSIKELAKTEDLKEAAEFALTRLSQRK